MEITLLQINEGEDKSSPFKNRLRKNARHVRKMGKRTGTDCFRIFDRDIKEYPFAIDYYAGRFLVQHFSYQGDEVTLEEENEIYEALYTLFNAQKEHIFWRNRIRRKKTEQYEKIGDKGDFFIAREYGAQFRINLEDYLDAGLFLDHRETRQMVARLSPGKKLLNLFAYTCSFSVHAALLGAAGSKSVDLSNTYTEWGKENFKLNQIDLKKHTIIRADCLTFLNEEKEKYDLIVIDPPTLSRSKKMEGLFDIQADHVELLTKALRLLASGGILFFSTNSREFKLDTEAFPEWKIEDITAKTIPEDFHNQKIHQCWRIKSKL